MALRNGAQPETPASQSSLQRCGYLSGHHRGRGAQACVRSNRRQHKGTPYHHRLPRHSAFAVRRETPVRRAPQDSCHLPDGGSVEGLHYARPSSPHRAHQCTHAREEIPRYRDRSLQGWRKQSVGERHTLRGQLQRPHPHARWSVGQLESVPQCQPLPQVGDADQARGDEEGDMPDDKRGAVWGLRKLPAAETSREGAGVFSQEDERRQADACRTGGGEGRTGGGNGRTGGTPVFGAFATDDTDGADPLLAKRAPPADGCRRAG